MLYYNIFTITLLGIAHESWDNCLYIKRTLLPVLLVHVFKNIQSVANHQTTLRTSQSKVDIVNHFKVSLKSFEIRTSNSASFLTDYTDYTYTQQMVHVYKQQEHITVNNTV